MASVTLRPDANGDRLEWDVWDTTHYGSTSDQTDATFIESYDPGGHVELLNLPASGIPSGSTINNVRVYFRAYAWGAGASEYCSDRIKTHGVEYTGPSQIVQRNVFSNYYHDFPVNPNTFAAWTIAEVDALQAGVAAGSLGRDEYVDVSEIWVVVDYTPPPVVSKPVGDGLTFAI